MSVESVMPSDHLVLSPPSPPAFNLSQHQGLFQRASSSHQVAWSIGASASAWVLLMNIQDWFPLRLTSLTSLLSKRLSRVFSSITVQKHQFFDAQSSLWSFLMLFKGRNHILFIIGRKVGPFSKVLVEQTVSFELQWPEVPTRWQCADTFPLPTRREGEGYRANCLSSLSLRTDKQISADIRACDWAGDVTLWIRTSGSCCIPSIPPLSENFPSGGWTRIILVCVLGQRNLELSLIVTDTRWPSFQHFGELATNTHWLLPSVEVS